MLDPVELQLFPSCPSCLAWSSDGELAVAAGEYVQILVPLHVHPQKKSHSKAYPDTQNPHLKRREHIHAHPQRMDHRAGARQHLHQRRMADDDASATGVLLAWSRAVAQYGCRPGVVAAGAGEVSTVGAGRVDFEYGLVVL